MLRLRICPNCQEEVRSPKAYFCHRCGAKLPSPATTEAAPHVEAPSQVKEKPAAPARQRLRRQALAGGLCAALCFAGVVYFYFQINPSRSSLPPVPSAPKNEAFVADISFEVPNHPFSAKGLSEIVPADVDLYLESIDPEILLPSLASAEDWARAESFFSEKLGLNVSEVTSFLEDEFAVVQESTGSAFLARVRDTDFVEQKIADVEEYEGLPAGRQGWQAKMVNGFLVVSNSSELIHAIEEAQKKLTLNLSLTAGFAEARQKLPRTGQMFYYGKKKLEFIPDSVVGEAFVIAKKNGGTLVVGL